MMEMHGDIDELLRLFIRDVHPKRFTVKVFRCYAMPPKLTDSYSMFPPGGRFNLHHVAVFAGKATLQVDQPNLQLLETLLFLDRKGGVQV